VLCPCCCHTTINVSVSMCSWASSCSMQYTNNMAGKPAWCAFVAGVPPVSTIVVM
jgi:hypothetical protein